MDHEVQCQCYGTLFVWFIAQCVMYIYIYYIVCLCVNKIPTPRRNKIIKRSLALIARLQLVIVYSLWSHRERQSKVGEKEAKNSKRENYDCADIERAVQRLK